MSVAISRDIWRVSLLAIWAAFLLGGPFSSRAFCRNSSALAAKQNRITYGIENIPLGNIVLKTNTAAPIGAPHIQYVQSQSGQSMMVADFDGLVWPYPARMIKVAGNQDSQGTNAPIDFINLGQFQTSPPIFRITVAAHSPTALKSLSFQAGLGSLTLSWAPPQDNPPAQAPERAPYPVAARPNEKHEIAAAPLADDGANNTAKKYNGDSLATQYAKYVEKKKEPLLPPARKNNDSGPLSLAFSTESLVGDAEHDFPNPTAHAPLVQEMPPLAPPAPVIPPTIDLTVKGNTKLEIKSQSKFSFKSFRLREPERLVIDFDDLPGLNLANIPTLEDNAYISQIRVGNPRNKATGGRLVCDLTSDTTAVETKTSDDGSTLSLTFKKESLKDTAANAHGVSIVLDAGHGGSDPGAQRGMAIEKEMTLPIVLFLKQKLEARGMRVTLTRSDDTFVSLEDRVRITNSTLPELFLSVHINSLDVDRDLHGIETYYQTAQSKSLAECVHESLVNHLDASDRAVRKARFYVINHTGVPAILAEVGFISCKEERDKLISSDYQKRIARALEHGVMLYLSKQSESLSANVAERKSIAQKARESSNQSAD